MNLPTARQFSSGTSISKEIFLMDNIYEIDCHSKSYQLSLGLLDENLLDGKETLFF